MMPEIPVWLTWANIAVALYGYVAGFACGVLFTVSAVVLMWQRRI